MLVVNFLLQQLSYSVVYIENDRMKVGKYVAISENSWSCVIFGWEHGMDGADLFIGRVNNLCIIDTFEKYDRGGSYHTPLMVEHQNHSHG